MQFTHIHTYIYTHTHTHIYIYIYIYIYNSDYLLLRMPTSCIGSLILCNTFLSTTSRFCSSDWQSVRYSAPYIKIGPIRILNTWTFVVIETVWDFRCFCKPKQHIFVATIWVLNSPLTSFNILNFLCPKQGLYIWCPKVIIISEQNPFNSFFLPHPLLVSRLLLLPFLLLSTKLGHNLLPPVPLSKLYTRQMEAASSSKALAYVITTCLISGESKFKIIQVYTLLRCFFAAWYIKDFCHLFKHQQRNHLQHKNCAEDWILRTTYNFMEDRS